ncbi:MAG TPA: Uma2 family endonuclease [Steroidobacteraceae bacterium]|nr:Uma2 family endonuclease [Steroidobacteraceae bacterium]
MIAVFKPAPMPISIDRYEKMAAAGVLTRDDRVELVDGEILEMAPIGTRHGSAAGRLLKRLILSVGDEAIVRAENPVNLGTLSQPQPDLLLLRPRADDYVDSRPGPQDVLLLIEVSDTTLDFDQGTKRNLYATFGIREYWVVDVNDRCLVAYSDPKDGDFCEIVQYGLEDALTPQSLPNVRIAVRELFASSLGASPRS